MENNTRLSKFLSDPAYYSSNQEPGIHKWTDTDTKRRFKQNARQQRKLMKATGWLDAPLFDYNINKHGFRGTWGIDNFTPNSIIAFGCSVTFGLGLPEEQSWPAILSANQGKPVYNLGMPGCGLESVYRVASFWVPRIQPEYVCLFAPSMYRREIWNSADNRWNDVGSWNATLSPVHQQLIKDEECWIAASRSVYALANLCARHSTKLILLYPDEIFHGDMEITGEFARDLSHPGVIYMQRISDRFEDDILHQRYFKEYSLEMADG